MSMLPSRCLTRRLGSPASPGCMPGSAMTSTRSCPASRCWMRRAERRRWEFRRVLLNKCQSEFEEGGAAMRAVEAREKRQREEDAAKVLPA